MEWEKTGRDSGRAAMLTGCESELLEQETKIYNPEF